MEFWLLQDNGLDPVTGEALSMDDLIPVKTNKVFNMKDFELTRQCIDTLL